MNLAPDIHAVLLCGGAGKRLWPLSSTTMPKQFSDSIAQPTLFAQTLQRFDQLAADYYIISNTLYEQQVADELDHFQAVAKQVHQFKVFLEPEGRNTAIAIALAALAICDDHGDEALLFVSPSDHLITNPLLLNQVIRSYAPLLDKHILSLGIIPELASTKYGYIELGEVWQQELVKVVRFREKPALALAEQYLQENQQNGLRYLWNSGIFVAKAKTVLMQLELLAPDLMQVAHREWQKRLTKVAQPHIQLTEFTDYAGVPNIAIDHALMEKADCLLTTPVHVHWSDMGSWQAIYEHAKTDDQQNSFLGEVHAFDVTSSFIKAQGKPIIAIGIDNLVVVENDDYLVISTKKQIEQANTIVTSFKKVD